MAATPRLAPENLQIAFSEGSRGHKILSLKGPLNLRTLFKFREAVRSESLPVLIVDFSGVPYIDSAGLGALVATYVSGLNSNRKILFVAFNDRARALIEMIHLKHILTSYNTIQDAEAALPG